MIDRLAQYHLLEYLGEGGLGAAYRARDTRFGRTTLVKIVPDRLAGDPDLRARLIDAAAAASALSHPNVATLFEVGEEGGRLFLAFEYVHGRSLRAELGGRPLNVRHALDLGAQMADALAAIHARGLVHGDLRPETIMVTAKGLVKLLDCGLAPWTRGGEARAAAAGDWARVEPVLAATVFPYLAPEQARGEPLTPASDIFALGAVLYEVVTGRPAFAGPTPEATRAAVLTDAPPPPSALNREVPPELDVIVLRALAKAPADRYQSAAVVAAELRSLATMLDIRAGEAEPPRLVAGVPRGGRGRRAVVALLVAGLAAGGWYLGGDAVRRAWRRWAGPPPSPVIVVLPFTPTGGDADGVLARGLAADLAARLGQRPSLRVVARATTFAETPRAFDLARRAGAGTLIRGTVERRGAQLRVTVHLTEGPDGQEWWRAEYRGEVDAVFALLAEIGADVARALDLGAPPGAAEARTASRRVAPRAYEAYVQGEAALLRGEFAAAIDRYRGAVAIDPTLAEAYAGLVEALYSDGWARGIVGTAGFGEHLLEAAESALQLDPDLPRAHLAAGLAAPTVTTALAALRRAVALDRGLAAAYRHLGDLVAGFDLETALRMYREAVALDPGVGAGYRGLAGALLLVQRGDEAIRAVAESRTAGVDEPWQRDIEAKVAFARGRYGEAAGWAVSSEGAHDVHLATTAVVALAAAGRRSEARRAADRLAAQAPGFCGGPVLQVALGDGRRGGAPVQSIWREAERAEAAPLTLVCAALAAAAVGDAPATARWIDRLARRDEGVAAVHQFAVYNLLGRVGDPAVVPWAVVARETEVVEAVDRLARARRRLQGLAARALAALAP
jgi:TolB-like protein